VRLLVASLVAAVVAASSAAGATGPAAGSAAFLAARQAESGGFAEQGRAPDATLTAWAALGLAAAGGFPKERAQALAYLRSHPATGGSDADLALQAMALAALGEEIDPTMLARLRAHSPGALVNETIWAVLALRSAGEQPPKTLVQGLLAAQAKGGGFSWSRGGAPDSNDTAAAIEALRSASASPAAVGRALTALATFRNKDGGYALTKGRESDAQSTAWAIQALLAAGKVPGKPPFRYLARLRRSDGSYRYSARYATTPVWVTSQVLPALTGKPFPLR